jgi:hypothetical protein
MVPSPLPHINHVPQRCVGHVPSALEDAAHNRLVRLFGEDRTVGVIDENLEIGPFWIARKMLDNMRAGPNRSQWSRESANISQGSMTRSSETPSSMSRDGFRTFVRLCSCEPDAAA